MEKLIIMIIMTLQSSAIFSQGLPDLFGSAPKQLLEHKILASYSKNTWLENLVIDENQNLYITDYPGGKVLKVSTAGKKELYATIEGKIAGIAVFHKTEFLITGWDKEGKAAVFKIDENRSSSKLLNISGGMFLNGIIHFSGDKYLIADSYAGCIWQYDATTNKATIWLKDELIARSSVKSEYPAANGLKIYGENLYVSNTEKQILVIVPILKHQPGTPVLYLDKVNIDDFTFDSLGNIYAATNIYNSVIKITREKKITVVADLSSGVAGSTAIVVGKDKSERNVLFVSTSGGMAVPPPTGVKEGKIVELSLNK